jgi:hypothetical protein
MAINYNRDGIIGINLPSQNNNYQNVAFKPGSLKDKLINQLYNIEQSTGFSNPKLDQLKQEDMQQFQDKGTPLSLPSDAYTAMAISNYDNLFGPQTFTDALGTTRTRAGLDRPDINTEPFNVNEGVTNTNSFRSMLLDDLRNLPSDLRTSLGQTKDALVEDFSGLKNFAQNIGSKGKDYGRMAIDGILSAVTGIPGIGLLLRGINPNPPSKIEYDYLSQSGYGPNLQSIYGPGGIMQGYNAISAFGRGPLNSIINRRNAILARKEAGKKYGKTNLEKLNQAIADLGVSEYRASRPESERNVTGPSGGGRDNTGGDIGSKGAADQFSNKSGFGRTGY